ESMLQLFRMFREMMGELPSRRIRTFVMDKMVAQMNAVKSIFNCDIHLCYFHVRQAIRRHVSCYT
ncbi:MAG: hypothetical protein ACRCTW_10580, partial [Lactococcus garvieae]